MTESENNFHAGRFNDVTIFVRSDKNGQDQEWVVEYIRGTARVGRFGEKTREARLRWYGHVRRKDDGYIGRRMLRMELKKGKPKRRYMDAVREDMADRQAVADVTEEDTEDITKWRSKIRCGGPWQEKPKEEEDNA